MVELNLSQLRSASDIDDLRREDAVRLAEKEEEIRRVTAENTEHVQRIAELTAYIQQASIDREQIIHQVIITIKTEFFATIWKKFEIFILVHII